jgi:hypothetical protein
MSDDNKIILTVDEALGLLRDGQYVHNYRNPSAGMFIGCDWDREEAERAIRNAHALELGGDNCKRMKHALVVWESKNDLSFFETDVDKVSSLEAAKS